MEKNSISRYLEAKTVVRVSSCNVPLYPHERKDDDFAIQLRSIIPTTDYRSIESFIQDPMSCTVKSFSRPRQAFIEADESEQRNILSSIIMKDLDLTKENLLWGDAQVETLEGIIERLLRVALDTCGPGRESTMMVIFMTKFVEVRFDEHEMLLAIIECQNPLSGWIKKNRKDLVSMDSSSSCWARQALFKLYRVSTMDNMFLGLKSVEVVKDKESSSSTSSSNEEEEEEEEGADCCTICLKGFRHGEIGISMPCSHVFHGFCILAWINKRKTCPLCRFELLN